MAISIIINALTERAAETRGQIAVLEGHIARQRADLGHVMATLHMSDPTAAGQPIRPKAAARLRATYFANGETSRRCRDPFRDATGPITADDIAAKAMVDKGLDPTDAFPSSEGRLRAVVSSIDYVAMCGVMKVGSVHERIDGHQRVWSAAVLLA